MAASRPLSGFTEFEDRDDYLGWLASAECQRVRRAAEAPLSEALLLGHSPSFFCHAHQRVSQLTHSTTAATASGYYWREAGACDHCGAITRIRFAAEWFHRAATRIENPQIYLTEQLTPLYKLMLQAFPGVVGSEYTPDEATRATSSQSLRSYLGDASAAILHEDVCGLSFADQSFDLIGCFDVLEHVPDYALALGEFRRVLRDGGQLLLTVPFLNASASTLVRARLNADNAAVAHLETPEYHGNPTLPGDGVLCFYHFGWDLLDALRQTGFRKVALLDAWGAETALFGDQNAIVATR